MLFFNFYYGDIYSDTESFLWEFLKALLAIIPVLGGILYQRHLEQKKEERIRQIEINKENENLKLQLFNFNEHLKAIIKSSDSVTPPFIKFSTNLLASPFEEHILWERISIPDLYRIDEINKESIFSAFLLCYHNKVDAANDYRKAFNSIDFYRRVFETLYLKYDKISQDIYNQKVRFNNRIFEIKKAVTEIIINNDVQTEPYKTVTEMIGQYSDKEKDMPVEKLTLQFYVDNLLDPLGEILPKLNKVDSLRQLYILVVQNLHLRDDIIHSSNELGNLIKLNTEKIPETIIILKIISASLDKKLQHYYA